MSQALTVENLVKVYQSGKMALKGISLAIAEGDFFALLGPNGAGKSTFIGIVSSLVTKTSGTVRVFEHSIDDDILKAKQLIGIVPQEFNFNIFTKTIDVVVTQAGYYGVPYRQAKEQAEHYLQQLGLWEKRNETVRFLSGGMKRRLMIARALVHQPKLLILDEPTAGVDIELRRSLWVYLEKLNQQGLTILLTTHYLEEVEILCKNVAIIDNGEILVEKSVHSLLGDLTGETLILDIDSILPEAPQLEHFTCRLVSPDSIEVDLLEPQTVNNLFTALDAAGIRVLSLRNKFNRLEELFIRLTGHTVVEGIS
ncbi:MAG: yadG [Gammaproteobacteria bacterium]|jgi:ABC-2 type transport system ATP-binding protein|nr:yadG [Gammaproteobacteria bacterium]